MEQKIIEVVENFERDISGILKNSIIDVIIYGSTVSGGFIEGKGDIDFLVFTDSTISNLQKNKIFDYHREIRKEKTLESQLEGCYYTVDKETKHVTGGIYLGTSECGWKEISEIVNTKLDMANIMNSYYSTHQSDILNEVFNFTWKEVERELKDQSRRNLSLIDKYDDYSFKVYAIYAAVRSLYTIEKRDFISKSQSLKWIMTKEKYNKYLELIKECVKLRNPLNKNEIQEIDKGNFIEIKCFLSEIDNDIQRQMIR